MGKGMSMPEGDDDGDDGEHADATTRSATY